MTETLKKEVLRKIHDRLRKVRDKNPDMYFAYPHRYQLKPVLSKDEINQYENFYQITFPEEYRFYLQEIGNGGTNGILQLDQVLQRRFPGGKIPDRYLSTSFPLSRSITQGELKNEGYFALSETEMEKYWIENTRGSIDIKDDYCGAFSLLVVSGKGKGEIWEDVMYADMGILKTQKTFWSLFE